MILEDPYIGPFFFFSLCFDYDSGPRKTIRKGEIEGGGGGGGGGGGFKKKKMGSNR